MVLPKQSIENKIIKRTTVGTLLSWGERFLARSGISSPLFCSEEILRFVLKKRKRSDLYLSDDTMVLQKAQVNEFYSLVERRGGRYPLQYITQEVGFLDFILKVHDGVFIPRPETEILVTETLKRLKDGVRYSVLDIGTGTGNIALSIAQYAPHAHICAVDISDDALRVAHENATRVGVSKQIDFKKSDCFLNIERGRTFDLIISNPPYIARSEFSSLEDEVRAEPYAALYGGGDGLDFYRHIVKEAPLFLNRRSLLSLEVGAGQAEAVKTILTNGNFRNSEIYKDYSHCNRVVIAEW
ncbi:MAG: peptide chain release factor N(5)-glutamine methyltransferase [Candidatus Omnitrophica bacterium]|nr:peptide chain release factor N(5)-glutamine methyltransferase [Candidatus Omnitrophota bacterium]